MLRVVSRFRVFLAAVMLAALAVTPSAQSVDSSKDPKGPHLHALRPGEFVVQKQAIPIDVVFIGYERNQINESALLAALPATYKPIVRYPEFYGLHGRDMGLEFRFNYRVSFANAAFVNGFFSHLIAIGTNGPVTQFQQLYNDQNKNVLNVTGPVLYIDGPAVERYLAGGEDNLQAKNTIYFINWYGRPDFRFHVYTKTDEADPDTNYNFGIQRASRKMIAWGGSSSRTWFYDLSAGPESWTNNWIVDDNQSEYHMPPVWEYRAGGYRAPSVLTGDLARVARYVGIDLLFTTSPLYDPLVTAPGLDGAKVAHIAMLEDDAGSSGLDFIKVNVTKQELSSFEPYYPWKVKLTDTNPIDVGAKRALDIFSGNLQENDCWNDFGTPFAQLFCYFNANLDKYIPAYKPTDYVGEIFAYNTTGAALGDQFGLLGFADDNWVDGTQTHVFMFDAQEYRQLGYGFTTTGIHEFGHHIGMSHPHDGYDSEQELDFGPGGPFEFAWSGDESHTVMHYLALTSGFGMFDRDNQYRWEMAGYLNWANAVAGDILKDPDAHRVYSLIKKADHAAREALEAFESWNHLEAAAAARNAYLLLLRAAKEIGVDTTTLDNARRPIPQAVRHVVCRIRNPFN